ncbi:MAG TPA: hypothetical protein VN628_13330, partial [Vicinamibacterales bacterium]|nr:hypothetical protein [Vicinamibacterales bacterium]
MKRDLLTALAIALTAAACGGNAPAPPATQPAAAPPPPVVPALGLYVTNEQSGDLSVIDIDK